MNRESLHRKTIQNVDKIRVWFRERSQTLCFPFYSSFDIRDAGFKLGPVDANIFPAGFNNICLADRESSEELARAFIDDHYSKNLKRILLVTEEHTNNPYYWDNVVALQNIIKGAGREVLVAIPRELAEPIRLTSASGKEVIVHHAKRTNGSIDIEGFKPELIISNNDFSTEYEEWARGLEIPMNPPRELGWYRRRKDRFFTIYNSLVAEFCDLLSLDPWLMQVETRVFSGFEVEDEDSRNRLAEQAKQVSISIQKKYEAHGISRPPFLFIKNNSGTYGLGVIQVKDPDEIKSWNYKARKKMKAAKGGREVNEVIIQEGLPTTVQSEGGATAEPVIYMIGCQLAGGFLRTHSEKGDEESLNSPGAVFQRLCISDMDLKLEGCEMENSYGWIAKLAFLAVAHEAKELGVDFRDYKLPGVCST